MNSFASKALAVVTVTIAIGAAAEAQESPTVSPMRITQEMPMDQIENILRDHPPQAENAARAFVFNIARNRIGNAEGPIGVPALDQLKQANSRAYWMEIAQLTVQFDAFQRTYARDSTRAKIMAAMFGTEFEARILQRSWRSASESERVRIRTQLETLMGRHFDVEDQLRALEMQDVERRLADVRAESERRRQRRAELVRWSVDDIIHGAERPDER